MGFYLVGSVLLLTGFFVGNRGVLEREGDVRAAQHVRIRP